MRSPVGISVALDEKMRPDNPAYSMFFEMLRAEGRRTQPVESFSDEALAEFGALLIGGPLIPGVSRAWPDDRALLRWLQGGGALLHVHDALGMDELDALHLSAFVPGHLPVSGPVGHAHNVADEGQTEKWVWDPLVQVDASTLVGQPTTLAYASGCGFGPSEELPEEGPVLARYGVSTRVLEALPLPSPMRALPIGRRSTNNPELFEVPTTPDGLDFPARGVLYLQRSFGLGTVTAFGSIQSLSNEGLARDDTLRFAQWLLRRWLPEHAASEVRRRMSRPQRHRMLHAYPMAPLTPPIEELSRAGLASLEGAPLPDGSGLVIGVLPHPFCNPAVRGCGFCTFPHEAFSQGRAREVASRVVAEIDAFHERETALSGVQVEAIYLGGGTANLTPFDDLLLIGEALARGWGLHGAEVTLEGVPVYYTARGSAVLDAFERAFPSCRRRLSMGVQTFDEAQIARMGRRAFGDRALIEGVLREAHQRGMTASADLLFDLPGQSLDQMLADIDIATAMGFDHVCLYHLVLFEGLGTEWSNDRRLLAALPDNDRASTHWSALRARLIEHGYTQTSLTNFERRAVHEGGGRFRYESCAYAPERFDILGFGPAALTGRFTPERALKLVNADGADEYVRAVNAGAPRQRAFVYGPRDARVLYLTRKVVTLGFERGSYRALFGSDAVTDFAMDFEALVDARLVLVDDARVTLTERGMFYADTVAGLLASRQVHDRQLRSRLALGRPEAPRFLPLEVNANYNHMG
jgi:coproporphyrinogen III oxidase-like Fe-S oxidoreductase